LRGGADAPLTLVMSHRCNVARERILNLIFYLPIQYT
jgi:hypothetical protein